MNKKMKLNIGCGNNYKEGYVNIDAYDNQIADKIMQADKLTYSSNTIEHIQAKQLIEHLGYYKTIYSLSEWFRVLKPNGTLLIETPDLETSFKIFLKADNTVRKNLITWIYGMESEGMSHLLCFPDDLLELVLSKTGFINIEKTFFGKEINQPTLRVGCKKPKKYDKLQAIANFRKKIITKKIVDLNKIYLVTEQEKLIDFLILKVNNKQKISISTVDEIVINGAVSSPAVTKIFLQELTNTNILDRKDIKNHLAVLGFLIKINYPSVLTHLLKQSVVVAGKQKHTYQTVEKLGMQSIKRLLGPEKEKTKKVLKELSEKSNRLENVFFSEQMVLREAENIFRQGVKEFSKGNNEKAIDYINEAVSLNRNNILYFWNLGKLYFIEEKSDLAEKCYFGAMSLINILENKKEKDILSKKVEGEKDNFSVKEHGRPIHSISDIHE